jgi:hypothetical protein
MNKKYRSWTPVIVFWTLFLGSIALGRRHRWVDAVWNATWLVFLLVVALCATVEIFRNRHGAGGYIGYRGVPRWVVALFGGEAERREPSCTTRQIKTNRNG